MQISTWRTADGEIVKLAEKAAEGTAEIIVAGGGDGTISAVAAEVMEARKILGVLPLGTLEQLFKRPSNTSRI